MFYRMYLSSVCHRRQWPDPMYEPFRNRHGYFCKVRVNNREYSTDVPYETEDLALDGAAMKAFMICRNFSNNDGMMPGQRPGQSMASSGVVQGLPAAIGSGRRSNRSSASSYESEGSLSYSDSSVSSGGTSPTSLESGFEQQMRRQPVSVRPHTSKHGRRNDRGPVAPPAVDQYICLCRRAPVHAYGRCAWCLRESGWA